MIDIPANSIDTFMANNRTNNQYIPVTTPVVLWGFGGLFAIIAVLLGIIWNDLKGELLSVETKISGISISQVTQGESLARLEEKTKYLERSFYAAKAVASGFKNPQIIPTPLNVNSKFESKTSTKAGEYFISYTVLKYDSSQDILELRVDAHLPGLVMKNNTHVITNVRHEQTVDITALTGMSRTGLPRVFLQIIDLPSPNHAIIAVGERTDPSPKAS